MGRLRWLAILLALAGCNLSSNPPGPAPEVESLVTTTPALSCDQVVDAALQTVVSACDGLGRNQACYGNPRLQADFREGASVRFDASGDRVELLSLLRLAASPFDQAAGVWGVAVLKAQANLPDTLPGQNVTFLIYGDASLETVTLQMTAVTVRTGPRQTACVRAPSAVLVQSPQGVQVTMAVNGASVTLGSTLHLTATQNGELTAAVVEGTIVISAFNATRIVRPGAQVRLPLGGADGLQVIGPPSEPEPYDLSLIQNAPLSLLERPVQPPPPILVTPTPPQSLLATPTINVTFRPQLPTLGPGLCTPRADWMGSYTIRAGDTLFAIAQRFGVSLTELQRGNCITDANRIQAGQTLRVPAITPTNTPRPTLTPTSVLPSPVVNFATSSALIPYGGCASLTWNVTNAQQVFFEGQPAQFRGGMQVCPTVRTTYTLGVVSLYGTRSDYTVTVDVALPFDPTATPLGFDDIIR